MQKVIAKPTILVIGASGQQGGAVAKQLLDQNKTFRALTRSVQKLRTLKERGIDVVEGNFHDRSTIKTALSGIKQVFLVTTPFEEGMDEEVNQGIAFVEMALEMEVEQLVFTSVASADKNTGIPHFESKWKIEQYIQKVGIPATILRPVFFMENFGSSWILPALQQCKLALPVRADKVMQMVSLDVIAAFALNALNKPLEYIGEVIELASDELSFPEAMQKLSHVSKKTITYEEMPDEKSEAIFGTDFAKMFRWFNEVGFSVNINNLKEHGIPLTDFGTYLEQAQWPQKIFSPG